MDNNLIKCLFLDVGGVLMSNGWGHELRQKVSEVFNIEYDEMNMRHTQMFDIYENGKITFDEYLTKSIFFKKRDFSLQQLKTYIFDAVRPFQEMMDFIKEVKKEHGLKVALVSNEGRELAEDRFRRFDMSFVDFFIVSSFVHYRKPDVDIYHLAIDTAQVLPSEILYIDDREFLTEIGEGLGMHAIWHQNIESTKKQMAEKFNLGITPASSAH